MHLFRYNPHVTLLIQWTAAKRWEYTIQIRKGLYTVDPPTSEKMIQQQWLGDLSYNNFPVSKSDLYCPENIREWLCMAKHGIIVQYTMNMHKWMTGQQTQEVPSGNLLHRYVKSPFS